MTYTQLQVYKKLQKFVQATGNAFSLFIPSQDVYEALKEHKKQKTIPPHYLKLEVGLTNLTPNRDNTTVTTMVDVSCITEDSQLLNLYALILGPQAPAMRGVQQVRRPMQMAPMEGMIPTELPRHQYTSILGGLFKQPLMASSFSDKFANKTGAPTFHSNYYTGAIRELFEKKQFVIKIDKLTGHPRSMQSPGTMQQITRICLPMDSRVVEKTRTLSPMDPTRAHWAAHPLNADCEVFQIIEIYENNNFLREIVLMPVGLLAGKWPSHTVDLSSPVINALHAAARMVEKTEPELVEILAKINLDAETSDQTEPYRNPYPDAIRELLTESRMMLDIEQQFTNQTELSQITHVYLAPDIRATAKVLSLSDSNPDKARWMAHPGYGKYEIFKLTEIYSQHGKLMGMKLEAVYADAPSHCIYIHDGVLSVNNAISWIKQKVEERMKELEPILKKAEQELRTGKLMEEAGSELPIQKKKRLCRDDKAALIREIFNEEKFSYAMEQRTCENGNLLQTTHIGLPSHKWIAAMLAAMPDNHPTKVNWLAHVRDKMYEVFCLKEVYDADDKLVSMVSVNVNPGSNKAPTTTGDQLVATGDEALAVIQRAKSHILDLVVGLLSINEEEENSAVPISETKPLNIGNMEGFIKEINAFHPAYKTKPLQESTKPDTLRSAILNLLTSKGAELEESAITEDENWITGGHTRRTRVYEPADVTILRTLESLELEHPDRAYWEAHPLTVRCELFTITEKIRGVETVAIYFEVSGSLSGTSSRFDLPLRAELKHNMLLTECMLDAKRSHLSGRVKQYEENKPK